MLMRSGWHTWNFALSTTLAALLALSSAMGLGIEHPWWAAMTVWLVAQPSRGLLLERSLARLAGSLVGAVVGYGLLVGFGDRPILALTGLIVWIALCTGAGAPLRHFRNYGMVLAGYTAGIIVPFGLMDPNHREALASGRVTCTLLGVTAVAVFTAVLTPPGAGEALAIRLRELLVQVMTWLADTIGDSGDHEALREEQYRLLATIGALEPLTDEAAAGSWHAHALARQQRGVLAALIGLLSAGRAQALSRSPPSRALRDAAAALGGAAAVYQQATVDVAALARSLPNGAINATADAPDIADGLGRLAAALKGSTSDRLSDGLPDWRDAGVAATRTALTVLLATALWQLTGWSQGPTLAMTATLFACLFSNSDRAITAVHDVLKGSLIGALVGVGCRLWLLPHAADPSIQTLMVIPFLAVGAFLMARPGTAKMAIDVNMTLLLVARPGLPYQGTVDQILEQVAAILTGVAIAVMMYHAVLPATRNAKLGTLARRMSRELERLAHAPERARTLYLRLRTQTLRVAVLADHGNSSSRRLLDQALSALSCAARCLQSGNSTQHTRHWSVEQVAETTNALRQATSALSAPIIRGQNDE